MNYKKFITIFLFLSFLYSCANYSNKDLTKLNNKKFFSSKGFALIYEDYLYKEKIINKKIANDKIVVFHSSLKRNTLIKVINPLNSKVLMTKVSKNATYPKIFNLVISKKVASILELDINNPYIEVIELKKNKTFIAKEGNIFEEEKNVAQKVTISEVIVDDLSSYKNDEFEFVVKNNFIIVISDFYYIDSAKNLKKKLVNQLKNKNFSIKKINNNQYRLLSGPFENFKALKSTYISLNNLGFDELNIYRE